MSASYIAVLCIARGKCRENEPAPAPSAQNAATDWPEVFQLAIKSCQNGSAFGGRGAVRGIGEDSSGFQRPECKRPRKTLRDPTGTVKGGSHPTDICVIFVAASCTGL